MCIFIYIGFVFSENVQPGFVFISLIFTFFSSRSIKMDKLVWIRILVCVSVSVFMDDAFIALARVAAASNDVRGGPLNSLGDDVFIAHEGSPDDGDDGDGLRAMVHAACVTPVMKFTNRSWEHTQHARSARRRISLEAQLADRTDEHEVASTALKVVALADNQLAQIMKVSPDLNDGQMAVVHMHISSMPVIRGDGKNALRKMQDSGAETVASYALDVQKQFVDDAMYRRRPAQSVGSSGGPNGSDHNPGGVAVDGLKSIILFFSQFDCASQRVLPFQKELAKKLSKGTTPKQRFGGQIYHVLMQNGTVQVMGQKVPGGDMVELTNDPHFSKPHIFDVSPDTDGLLHALLRNIQLPIVDVAALNLVAANHDSVFLGMVLDRATTNTTSMTYVCYVIDKHAAPNVYVHVEPCGCHSSALTKAAPKAASGLQLVSIAFRGWPGTRSFQTHSALACWN